MVQTTTMNEDVYISHWTWGKKYLHPVILVNSGGVFSKKPEAKDAAASKLQARQRGAASVVLKL